MNKTVKAIPEGYQAVIPYLVVDGAEKLVQFLTQAFHAKELMRIPGQDGKIGHAEMRIGDCVVMLADAQGPYKAMPAMIYVYLEDVDAAYQRALQAGATSDREPKDQFYGDRTAGVTDTCGNQWYIGTHIEDVSQEEMMRRQQAGAGH